MSKDITIVGGGVIGLCCAYFLQKSGSEVTVIERGDITNGTSFGNAGYISPSHFIPLASPGIVSKGLRWMLSASSPFYIKPRFDMDLIKWGVQFRKNANENKVRQSIPALNDILHFSRELTIDIKNQIGNTFRMQEIGCLMLYKSGGTENHEIELAKKAAGLGIETRILSSAEVQALEPEIEVKVRGGVLYPIDCHLHPGDFMKSLKEHLINAGVKFQLNTEVTGFEFSSGHVKSVLTNSGKFECEELIIAAGSWLPVIANMLNIRILLQAGKGYSITYQNMQKNLRYPAILVDNRVAMTPMGRDLRMGGTMEISGINDLILIKRVEAIFKAAKLYYPSLNVEFPKVEKIWRGLRPLSPDGLPYIGRHSKFDNLVFAGGHAMLGLSLAAGTGKLVAEIIRGETTSVDVSAYSIDRFN